MPETIDLAVCCRMFARRKLANRNEERMNNSALPAGSPMYYYCKGCDDHIITLPEGHRSFVYTICTGCEVLKEHGLLKELMKLVEGDAEAVTEKVKEFISKEIKDGDS